MQRKLMEGKTRWTFWIFKWLTCLCLAEELLAKEHELSELALERQREEYEKKIKNLEFQGKRLTIKAESQLTCLVNVALSEARGALGWTPHELRLARNTWEKWRKYQFTSLRDQIWGHAVWIKEANAIAMELNKQVEFQFTLLREGVYSPLPSDIPPPQPGQSSLVVEVRDQRHGAIHYWSLSKLRTRLDSMRKLYEAASEPPTPVKSAQSLSRKSSNAGYVEMHGSASAASTPLKEKPFPPEMYDTNQLELDFNQDGSERPQWLRLVGRLKSASMSCLSEAGGRLMSPSNSPISPHVPMSPQVEMAHSAGGMETALFSLLSSSDPFYDRTPWFKVCPCQLSH